MLSNVCSMGNKMDFIRLCQSTQRQTSNCCVFIFTEKLLNNITGSAIQLHGLTWFRGDRDTTLSDKAHGGGLCVYINKEWCNNAVLLSKHCSSLVEFMFVKCQPLYLPRELMGIVIVAVYISSVPIPRMLFTNCTALSASNKPTNLMAFSFYLVTSNHANLKTIFAKVLPTCELHNKGEQQLGPCLQNRNWLRSLASLFACLPPILETLV